MHTCVVLSPHVFCLKIHFIICYQILIVDDGSIDSTVQVALKFAEQFSSIEAMRVLKMRENRGKGGAVKQGMLLSKGRYILMVSKSWHIKLV